MAAPEGEATATSSCPMVSVGGGELESSWRRVVQGRTVWISSGPSPEEVEELTQAFPEIIVFPEEEVREGTNRRASSAVVARSLGQRVPVEVVVRDFRARAELKGEIVGHALERGVFFVRFKDRGEQDTVLRHPWMVMGQVIVIEPWRPGMLLTKGVVRTAALWIRLPWLPMELWGEVALRRTVRSVDELLALDDCMATQRRLGFTRVAIRVNLSRPLRPEVLLKGVEGVFW